MFGPNSSSSGERGIVGSINNYFRVRTELRNFFKATRCRVDRKPQFVITLRFSIEISHFHFLSCVVAKRPNGRSSKLMLLVLKDV
jgi:hypothetical protein